MGILNKLLLMIILMFEMTAVFAADPVNLNINISGTIVANGSCTFSGDKTANVDFKEIDFATVNNKPTLSGTYRESVPSVMTCSGDYAGKTQMSIISAGGNTVDYQGQKLLPVTVAEGESGQEIAIRILVNGDEQDINIPFAVNMSSPPVIQAELVQVGDGSTLVSGSQINASATLVMEFL